MAGSGSYARGDQPRSVPDELKGPYDEMTKRQKAHNAKQEVALQAKSQTGIDWTAHPGTAESLVPVWGSAREAIADYHEGDIVGAVANGALAVTDLSGQGYVLKSLAKGGLKVGGSHTWKKTREWMGHKGKGLLEEGQHGHHWLIPRNGWGKNVPDVIKNQPWNIKGMPNPQTHGRIHGPRAGLPQFNAVERYKVGTPTWWKVQNGVWAGHAATGAQEGLNPAARNDRARGTAPR